MKESLFEQTFKKHLRLLKEDSIGVLDDKSNNDIKNFVATIMDRYPEKLKTFEDFMDVVKNVINNSNFLDRR